MLALPCGCQIDGAGDSTAELAKQTSRHHRLRERRRNPPTPGPEADAPTEDSAGMALGY